MKASASLAIVVLSPPGMIKELTVRSCSGFRISTPLTPNLLRAETQTQKVEGETVNEKIGKQKREREKVIMPAMCSLKEPCKARTPTTAMLCVWSVESEFK